VLKVRKITEILSHCSRLVLDASLCLELAASAGLLSSDRFKLLDRGARSFLALKRFMSIQRIVGNLWVGDYNVSNPGHRSRFRDYTTRSIIWCSNFVKRYTFVSSPKRPYLLWPYTAFYSVVIEVLSREKSGRGLQLARLYLMCRG
jgi:hypothetical protein